MFFSSCLQFFFSFLFIPFSQSLFLSHSLTLILSPFIHLFLSLSLRLFISFSTSISISPSSFLSSTLHNNISLFFYYQTITTELDSVKALLVSAQQTSADLAAASIRQEKVMADERMRAQASLSEVRTLFEQLYSVIQII